MKGLNPTLEKKFSISRMIVGTGGFTLIELMIAAAVFVGLSVIAVPSIRGLVDNMSGNRAVHEIVSDLNVVKSLAIRHGRPAWVDFNTPAAGQYTVTWNVSKSKQSGRSERFSNRGRI